MKPLVVILLLVFIGSCATPQIQRPPEPLPRALSSSSMCRGCHYKIFSEHAGSDHEKSFDDAVFQAQYFKELLPRAGSDPALLEEAAGCIRCHAPVAYMMLNGLIDNKDDVGPELSGVSCDFCHSIRGYRGETPGSGNYIAAPDDLKCGPFRHEGRWHPEYCPLQTTSEFCGICHNAVNHNGLEVKSTYTEWKESSFARKGVQCQDCHMNLMGFLMHDKAAFDSGRAASMNVGQAPWRSRLFSHRFPGAGTKSQLGNAVVLSLDMEADRQEAAPGELVHITVTLGNEKAGHSMPSGSADLRLLWVELDAHYDGKTFRIPAASAVKGRAYDIAGQGELDKSLLQKDLPEGSRIYRAVYLDDNGMQTLAFYKAASIIFDNRLKAEEVRRERYSLRVPIDAKGTLTLTAMLKYLRYPSGFASRLGVERAETLILSAATKELRIRPMPIKEAAVITGAEHEKVSRSTIMKSPRKMQKSLLCVCKKT